MVLSTNDGASWQHITPPLLQVSDAAIFPNGLILVSGTGQDNQGYILRSLDKGKSWEAVQTVPVVTKKNTVPFFGGGQVPTAVVTSLAIDPFNADRVYAATSLGSIFIGEQNAKVWRLFQKTNTSLLNSISGTSSIRRIIPSPFKAEELLLLTTDYNLLRLRGGMIYQVHVLKGSQGLTQNFTERKVFDVTYIQGQPKSLLVGAVDGVTVTKDDGGTWQSLDLPIQTAAFFNSVKVAVSPTNAKRFLVAVNNVIYRSEDGGNTWNTYSLELNPYLITDFSINPANAARVLLLAILQQT